MTEERQVDVQAATDGIRQFLNAWGIDLEKTGMADTPMRVVEAYGEFFSGLNRTDEDLWKNPIQTDTTGIVALRNLEYYSLCEHHLLPFFGTVDVIYQPHSGCVAGLSKFNDVITVLSRKPQLQERLTREIADAIERDLSAEGVFVRLKATQLCMLMKGTLQQGSQVVTIESRGLLREAGSLRDEALAMLGGTNV